MAGIRVETILKATVGRLLSGEEGEFAGVSIDTRTISEGDLFFALRGERFDGHDFLGDALNKCGGAVVGEEPSLMQEGKVIIFVEDTLKALQDLAHLLRSERTIPVVGITGSNGKTTTKEMASAIISKKYRVLKNEGNLNNHIGLPLTLTRLSKDDEVAVLELGMNASGEIRRLCEISEPSHGVVTNIGSAHLGRLGSYEAVRSAKLEILTGLKAAVLNADDNFLMSGIKGFDGEVITFSIRNDSHVMAQDLRFTEEGAMFRLKIKDEEPVDVALGLYGEFNVYNALAAAAVSYSIGISTAHIKEALEEFRPFSMRFEVLKVHEMTLINDAYNANPSSIKEALKEMTSIPSTGRRVAVLGDMFELDEFSEEAHRALGKMISDMGIDVFVAVGELMVSAAAEFEKSSGQSAGEVYRFRSSEEASEKIKGLLSAGDTVLVKGSRGMQMEKVIGGVKNAV